MPPDIRNIVGGGGRCITGQVTVYFDTHPTLKLLPDLAAPNRVKQSHISTRVYGKIMNAVTESERIFLISV
jgi:hypothetical protein